MELDWESTLVLVGTSNLALNSCKTKIKQYGVKKKTLYKNFEDQKDTKSKVSRKVKKNLKQLDEQKWKNGNWDE